jgi:hypothetical protein
MRAAALFLLSFIFMSVPNFLSASSAKYTRIGRFDVVAPAKHFSLILDDGNTYKPISKYQRNRTKSWQLGDSILVLRIRHQKRYLFINTHNGQKAKFRKTVRSRLPSTSS